MMVKRESELRMALRHVQTGRRCIMRQVGVIATLRRKGLATTEAETVLHWLEEMQSGFEDHYRTALSEGSEPAPALLDYEAGSSGALKMSFQSFAPNLSGDK